MNAVSKHLLVFGFTVPVVFSLYTSCSDSTTNPISGQASTIQAIPQNENVIWTLSAAEKSDRKVDISALPPFHLIFGESRFFGDDGCNWFGATFETHNDSIFPENLVQTERACDQATFPIGHLAEPFRLRIDESELRILAANATYTYRSDFTKAIQNSALLGSWQLSNSTDTEFEDIQEQQLIPILDFDASREFNLIWHCDEGNLFGCDKIGGLFGIGSGGKMTFYQRESAYHAEGANFMQRILNASSYTVTSRSPEGTTLTLFNKDNSTSFEFIKVSKTDSSSGGTISFGDTLEIAHKDTLFNAEENIAITFDSLRGDSRCPVNVECFWEGNAELGFVFTRDDQRSEFSLNTSGNFTTSVVKFDFEIALLDVLPVQHTDSTFVADDYIARVKISKLQ